MTTSNTASAINAFIARKTEIDVMLERIKALSDEHFDTNPDEINWGHVGTLGLYAELLKRITDSAIAKATGAAS